jgi:hypothetical protein
MYQADFPSLVHVCIWPLTFLAWSMYVSDRWLSWLSTCMYLTVDFPALVHVCICMYKARKVNGQIHTCTKPGKSTVRYIHVLSQESQRSDTYMYQARKVNDMYLTVDFPGLVQVGIWPLICWLGTYACMYLTVDFPGLVHVCIWPLTFMYWYMYVSDRCTKPGKSTVRYIHVPSQESQRSDTYMYQSRKVNGQIHTCIWPLTFLAWYMYVSDCWLSWLGTCMYLTVDFPGLVHVCIWPLTFLV